MQKGSREKPGLISLQVKVKVIRVVKPSAQPRTDLRQTSSIRGSRLQR